MENSMFCYQCQEASKGVGCTLKGVCGKNSSTSAAMRHEFIPALSFSYRPAINKSHFKSYFDSTKNETQIYSPTEGFLYGRPLEKQSAALSLTFSNKLEMKVAN